MTIHRFDGTAIPASIVSGPGCRSDILSTIETLGCERIVIVASHSLATGTEFLVDLKSILGDRVVAIVDRVEPNLPVETVRAAVQAVAGHKPQAIIAIGGGIVHDMAKAIAVMVPSGRDIVEFVSRFEPPDTFHGVEIEIDPLPVITIPSTFSAADVVAGGAVTDTEKGEKLIFVHPKLTPSAVFLDGEVVASTPRSILAASGMNAIHHCLEAGYSRGAQPITDAFAFAALRRLINVLPAFAPDADEPSLEIVQAATDAASMSGLTYANSWLGIGHSVCHSLGGRYDLSHSAANSVMVLQSLRFNFDAALPRLAEAGRAAGLSSSANDNDAANALVAAVESVADALKTPRRLSEIGLAEGLSARIAQDVLADPQTYWNPRRASAEEITAWLDSAW